MIRSIFYPQEGPTQKDLTTDQIKSALLEPEGLLWVSLEAASVDEINLVLRDAFNFHPLSIEDCLSDGYQTPKIDDYVSYLFILANAILDGKELSQDLDTNELNLYLGSNYLVTCYTSGNMPCIDSTWKRLERDERLHIYGADFLCHAILDTLVDDYMPLLDKMDEEIEWLEDEVIEKPRPKTLERVLLLKHVVMALRRHVSPLREVTNRLSRDEFPLIDRQSRIYFRDIYDHLVRIQDLTESIRDIVSGALDIYLSSTSLRLNEVMKALTIVSTIFLPLSFLAGVYGMNFKYMPELDWGYPLVWVAFLAVGVGMLIFFKRRKWF